MLNPWDIDFPDSGGRDSFEELGPLPNQGPPSPAPQPAVREIPLQLITGGGVDDPRVQQLVEQARDPLPVQGGTQPVPLQPISTLPPAQRIGEEQIRRANEQVLGRARDLLQSPLGQQAQEQQFGTVFDAPQPARPATGPVLELDRVSTGPAPIGASGVIEPTVRNFGPEARPGQGQVLSQEPTLANLALSAALGQPLQPIVEETAAFERFQEAQARQDIRRQNFGNLDFQGPLTSGAAAAVEAAREEGLGAAPAGFVEGVQQSAPVQAFQGAESIPGGAADAALATLGAAFTDIGQIPGVGDALSYVVPSLEPVGEVLQLQTDILQSVPVAEGLPSVGSMATAAAGTIVDDPTFIAANVNPGTTIAYLAANWNAVAEEFNRRASGLSQSGPRDAASLITYSGLRRQGQAQQLIRNRDQMVAELNATAAAAFQASNDPSLSEEERNTAALESAQAGAQATQLANMTPAQMAGTFAVPWRQFAGEASIDLLNLVDLFTGGAAKSRAIRSATEAADLSDLTALATRMDDIAAMRLSGELFETQTRSAWENATSLFRQTPETQAVLATDTLYRAVVNSLANVRDIETARSVMQAWFEDPRRLIGGMEAAVDDLVEGTMPPNVARPENLIASPDVIESLPILAAIQEAVNRIPELQGQGIFDPQKFTARLHGELYGAARKWFGADAENLSGVAKVDTIAVEGGERAIQFYDENGEVIRTSEPLSTAQADRLLKRLQFFIRTGSQERVLTTIVREPDRLVRSIMSTFYLNLAPRHWIRNATSFLGHMVTDRNLTFLPTQQIIDEVATANEGLLPSTRFREAALGDIDRTRSAISQTDASRRLIDLLWPDRNRTGNLLTNINNTLGEIWNGSYALADRVPIGEQNAYMRSYYVAWRRAMIEGMGRFAADIQGPLTDILGPEIAPLITSTLKGNATAGRRALALLYRDILDGRTVPFSLEQARVSDDAITVSGLEELRDIFNSYDGTNIDEIRTQMQTLMDREARRLTPSVDESPRLPVQRTYTELDNLDDQLQLVDDLERYARKAGIDPEEARQQAESLSSQVIESTNRAIDSIVDEAQLLDDPQALRISVDAWREIHVARREARRLSDESRKRARAGDTSWGEHYDYVNSVWGDFSTEALEIRDRYRNAMGSVRNGGEYSPSRTAQWEEFERIALADEQELLATAATPTTAATDAEFSQILAANRGLLDKAILRAYSTFKRYGSVDAMDILGTAEQMADHLGANAAAISDRLYESFRNKEISFDEMRQQNNQLWTETFDLMIQSYNTAQWRLVSRSIGDDIRTGIRWTDDIYGEVELVRQLDNGDWRAAVVEDGSYIEFSDPDSAKAKPAVPEEVIEEWQALPDDARRIIELEIQDINRESLVEDTRPPLPDDEATAVRSTLPVDAGQLNEGDAVYTPDGTPGTVVSITTPAARPGRTIRVRPASGGRPANYVEVNLRVDNPDFVEARTAQLLDDTVDLDSLEGPSGQMVRDCAAYREANPYTTNPAAENPLHGIDPADEGDLRTAMGQGDSTYTNADNAQTFEVGDSAQFWLDELQRLRVYLDENIENILGTGVGEITPQQRASALSLLDDALAGYDTVRDAASRAGENMGRFTLLDFALRRGFDNWLPVVSLYHYWYTRSGINWARRLADNPSLLNKYLQMERAIEQENEQTRVPRAFEGTIPVPGTNQRIPNPLRLLIPFDLLESDDWINAENSKNGFERAVNNWQKYFLRLGPHLEAGYNYYTGDPDQTQLGDFFWPWDWAQDISRATTGQPIVSGTGFFGENEFNQGVNARQVAEIADREGISESDALFAQDVLSQQQTGAAPFESQPEGAEDLATRATQEAARQQLWTQASSFFLGLGARTLSDERLAYEKANAELRALGYDRVENPTGSQRARSTFLELENLGPWWTYSSLYPTAEDPVRPGVRAETTAFWDEVGPVYDEMRAASADFIVENQPTAAELREFQSQFYERIEEIKAKYPNRLEGDGVPNLNGANPIEAAHIIIEDIIQNAEPPERPQFPEGGTDEEKRQYYAELAAWESAFLDNIERGLRGFVSNPGAELRDVEERQTVDQVVAAVQGEYAKDLLIAYRARFASNIEKAYRQQLELEKEQRNAIEGRIREEGPQLFGEDIEALEDSYPFDQGKAAVSAWIQQNGEENWQRLRGYWDWKRAVRAAPPPDAATPGALSGREQLLTDVPTPQPLTVGDLAADPQRAAQLNAGVTPVTPGVGQVAAGIGQPAPTSPAQSDPSIFGAQPQTLIPEPATIDQALQFADPAEAEVIAAIQAEAASNPWVASFIQNNPRALRVLRGAYSGGGRRGFSTRQAGAASPYYGTASAVLPSIASYANRGPSNIPSWLWTMPISRFSTGR